MPPSLFESPAPRRSTLRRLAACFAWIFALFTLTGLGYILEARWNAIDRGTCCVFEWSTPSGEHRAGWLLSFVGASGYYLALAEFVLILAALVASALRISALRQAGLLILLAWSVLWFAGAARMLVGTQEWTSLGVTAATALAVVATYSRTRQRWSAPPRLAEAPPSTAPRTRPACQ